MKLKFHEKGFTEPTFEFLNDNSILCIMRTSGGKMTSMYKSYSSDYGKNWTTPEPFTPNGVMPQLVRLDNDVLVLASRRPGIQLRFSFDGKGDIWSQPTELIDYDETAGVTYNTCRYPFIYKSSKNEVYIVYSNFHTENDLGELRKGIIFRNIKVVRI